MEIAEGVGWVELVFGVDGGDGGGAVVVEEEDGDVDDEFDDECEDIIFRTRNRIVAC